MKKCFKRSIIKHVHSCFVTWDSGRNYILFAVFLISLSSSFSAKQSTIAAVVELQICLINNKTEHQPKSRLSGPPVRGSWLCLCCGQFLQLVPSVRTLMCPWLWWHSERADPLGFTLCPWTKTSHTCLLCPVAALLWEKAPVDLCFLSWPRATWVTPTFWAALKVLFGYVWKWYTICFAICCLHALF